VRFKFGSLFHACLKCSLAPMKPLLCHFESTALPAAIVATLFLLPCDHALGDYLVLKNGERHEGKIIAEDGHSVTITLPFARLNTKDKTYLKSDLAQIFRETPAQVEFRAKRYEALIPSRDLMTVEDYDSLINDYLRRFIARFPGTPEAKLAQDMVATLTEERDKVHAGGLKVEGKWLDAAAVKRELYEIDAYRNCLAMKNKLTEKPGEPYLPHEIAALRDFEELRRGFPASLHYVKAIPEALAVLDAYERRLELMVREQPVLVSERQGMLLQMRGGPDEMRVLNAIAEEKRSFEDRRKAETESGVKWRDVYRHDLDSLRAAQTAAIAERKELEAIDLAALKFENENLSSARRCLLDGKPAEAEVFLKRLRPRRGTLMNEVAFAELERLLAQATGR
jgi:hypothetical protein